MRSLIIITALTLCTISACRGTGSRTLNSYWLRTPVQTLSIFEQSKAFYNEVLGLGPYVDEPLYMRMRPAISGNCLVTLNPRGEVDRGVVVYWGVEDIDAEYDRLIELGAKPHTPIENVGGEIRVAVVLDPAGNQFGMIYNPAFKLP